MSSEQVSDGVEADLFGGDGEMRARCRALNWAATPLGPVAHWSPALRSAVRLCLDAGFAACLHAGPELVAVYNDRYRATLGALKHPGALGRPLRVVWSEVWPEVAPEFAQVLAGGAPVNRENQRFMLVRDERPDEAYFTYSLSPVRDESGAVIAVFNIAIETTAQVLAERQRESYREALAAEREHLKRVIEQAPVAMYIATGREHVFEVVSASWYRIAGKRPEEVLGRSVRDVFPELVPQGIVDVIERVYDTGEPFVAPAMPVVIDADGDGVPEDRFFNVVYQPLHDAAGAVYAIALVATEVTELVQARRTAEEAQAAAEAANRSKSEFLAVMSHELRTPLNAISGYTDILDMGIHGPVTEAQRNSLGRIRSSQQHLLGLINDVLNYAKLETGTVHYHITEVHVQEVFASVEAIIAPQVGAAGLTLVECDSSADLWVRADAEKLRQILLNLLSNAIKFTRPHPERGRIELACLDDGDHVRLEVRDTGIGISADKLESIFEPFVQVRADLTRTEEGTGLGLAISRDLARGMGGDLRVTSAPGEGSTFTLILPSTGYR